MLPKASAEDIESAPRLLRFCAVTATALLDETISNSLPGEIVSFMFKQSAA